MTTDAFDLSVRVVQGAARNEVIEVLRAPLGFVTGAAVRVKSWKVARVSMARGAVHRVMVGGQIKRSSQGMVESRGDFLPMTEGAVLGHLGFVARDTVRMGIFAGLPLLSEVMATCAGVRLVAIDTALSKELDVVFVVKGDDAILRLGGEINVRCDRLDPGMGAIWNLRGVRNWRHAGRATQRFVTGRAGVGIVPVPVAAKTLPVVGPTQAWLPEIVLDVLRHVARLARRNALRGRVVMTHCTAGAKRAHFGMPRMIEYDGTIKVRQGVEHGDLGAAFECKRTATFGGEGGGAWPEAREGAVRRGTIVTLDARRRVGRGRV